MRSQYFVSTVLFVLVVVGTSRADTVWIDTFNGTGAPGTDLTWFSPWPAWTSVGITYYEGTTQTLVEGYYICGSVCTTPTGVSEYSYFGSFYFPSTNPASGAMFSSGIALGQEDGYFGVADRGSQTVHIFDVQDGIGQTWIASTPFALQEEVWYNYRQEADLSGSIPWVRLKVWERAQPEPAYWTAEGWGVENHPGQYIIVQGGDFSATGKVWFDDVGIDNQIAPRHVTDLAAAAMGSDLQLSWTQPPTADSANLYHDTTPYFTPEPGTEVSGLTTGDYAATGAVGDENTNHFYLVRGVNESGEGMVSNRVGEFDFSADIP